MLSRPSRQNPRRVTLKDIAERVGYTQNTVSRALKDKDDIGVETRRRIQEAAREMGYILDTIAGSLRSGLTKTMAVILGDISNPHFSIIVKEIEATARKYHYNTIILNTDEDAQLEREALISALGRKVDGIILCPTQDSTDNVQFLRQQSIPFVLIGRYFPELDVDSVVCDDLNGGREGTRHLIELGHSQILFLNGPLQISSARERLQGYKDALEAAGIAFRKDLVWDVPIVAGDCRKTIDRILKKKVAFTAIVAFSDLIAWEAMYALQTHGLEFSRDYAIVGFDNTQSKFLFPYPITSVGSSKSTMGPTAVNLLMEKLSSSQPRDPKKQVLGTKLIVRTSSIPRELITTESIRPAPLSR